MPSLFRSPLMASYSAVWFDNDTFTAASILSSSLDKFSISYSSPEKGMLICFRVFSIDVDFDEFFSILLVLIS